MKSLKRILGRDNHTHVNVVRTKMPLHYLGFLVPGQLMKDLAQVLVYSSVDCFLPSLGNEHDMILAIPSSVV